MNSGGRRIILASASPRRRELLAQIGMDFEVMASAAEEKTECPKPSEMVRELSRLKAGDVFDMLPENEKRDVLVIGADTVVSLEDRIMGKPKGSEEAVGMLRRLQGKTHQVYTGVTLIWKEEKTMEVSFYEETDVAMFPMTEEEIRGYVATGEPLDKAGAYGIQGKFAAYIKGITGDYYNVVGLPVGRLCQEMKKAFSVSGSAAAKGQGGVYD